MARKIKEPRDSALSLHEVEAMLEKLRGEMKRLEAAVERHHADAIVAQVHTEALKTFPKSVAIFPKGRRES
jgi:hypothetical protein